MKLVTNNIKETWSLFLMLYFIAYTLDVAQKCPTPARDALIMSSIGGVIFYAVIAIKSRKF